MFMESKEEMIKSSDKKKDRKDFSLRSLFNVIRYSLSGFINFYRYERSAVLHLITAIVIIITGLFLKITMIEWLFIIFILLVMLAVELLNTAIETICDLVSPGYNKLVKIAKDSASAATFSISIALVIAICIIYVPKIIRFLGLKKNL